jgi:hypothetical protein
MKNKISILHLVELGVIQRDLENLLEDEIEHKAELLGNELFTLIAIVKFLDNPEEYLNDLKNQIGWIKTA